MTITPEFSIEPGKRRESLKIGGKSPQQREEELRKAGINVSPRARRVTLEKART